MSCRALISLAPAHLQAAAAARIKGQPGIHNAAASGNAGLVRDHIVADPAAVLAKGFGYVVLPSFIFSKIYSLNPVAIVASNFPLHP